MSTESLWLQAGPARRCARAAVLWGVLTVSSAALAVFSFAVADAHPWTGWATVVATAVLAALTLMYGLSCRVHRAREARPE